MERVVALPDRISSTLLFHFFLVRGMTDLEGIKGCLIDLLS